MSVPEQPLAPPAESTAPAPLTIDQAQLLPFYHELRNEIVESERVVVNSHYFWTKWAPLLGPTLTVLVVCLRRHCYYNKLTRERRDWCFPEQATLARAIGVEATKTVRAALHHPFADRFIRREARYTYDPQRQKKVRTSDMYFIAMDDPLTPEDEQILLQRASERLHRSSQSEQPHCETQPEGQFDRQVSPTGRIVPQMPRPDSRSFPQDSAVNLSPEPVHEDSTCTITSGSHSSSFEDVLLAFGAANGRVATPAERARLAALAEQFDPPARIAQPPSTGASWVAAAIAEAVESGSAFVAPRRIARICARWAETGFESPFAAHPGSAERRAEPAGPERRAKPHSTAQRPRARSRASDVTVVPVARPDLFEADRVPELEPDDLSGSTPAEPPAFVVFPDRPLSSRVFWSSVVAETGRSARTAADRAWLEATALLARDEDCLIVRAPSRFAAQLLESRYAASLAVAAGALAGRAVRVRFVVAEQAMEG